MITRTGRELSPAVHATSARSSFGECEAGDGRSTAKSVNVPSANMAMAAPPRFHVPAGATPAGVVVSGVASVVAGVVVMLCVSRSEHSQGAEECPDRILPTGQSQAAVHDPGTDASIAITGCISICYVDVAASLGLANCSPTFTICGACAESLGDGK